MSRFDRRAPPPASRAALELSPGAPSRTSRPIQIEPDGDDVDDDDDDDDDELDATLALPPAASDTLIEATVRRVNGLARSSGIQLTLGVGRLLIEAFYEGDRAEWRRRGKFDQSFRKLAAHPLIALSATALQRCCASVEMVDRLSLDVATWQHLTPSHLRVVLSVPHAHQRALLIAAEHGGWPVQRLSDEASRHRRHDGRGRKPLPPFVKTANKLNRILTEAGTLSTAQGVIEMADSDFESLLAAFRSCRQRLDAVEEALQERRNR